MFKMQTEKYANFESPLNDLDPAISLYFVALVLFTASLTLCFCKKPRGMLIEKLKEIKKEMLWNGLISFFDGYYISHCLLLAKAIKVDYDQDKEAEDQIGIIIKIVVYFLIVFVG